MSFWGSAIEGRDSWGGNLLYNTDMLYDADGVQPVLWDEEDANITLTREDAVGEAIPDKTRNVFKAVNGGAGGGKYIKQTLTFASEDLLDASVSIVSTGVWVYTGSAGTITLDLYDNGGAASLGTATTTTTGGWVWLEVLGKTIGTTSLDFRLKHSANSATFYFCLPGLNVGPTVAPWGARNVSNQLAVFADEKSAGTQGGTFTSGAWRTRDINTTRINRITGISLSANQLTIPAGTWYVLAKSAAFAVDLSKLRFYNTTDASLLVQGENSHASSASSVPMVAELEGIFVISAQKVCELQHICLSTRATDGFGIGQSMAGEVEIYSTIILQRLT